MSTETDPPVGGPTQAEPAQSPPATEGAPEAVLTPEEIKEIKRAAKRARIAAMTPAERKAYRANCAAEAAKQALRDEQILAFSRSGMQPAAIALELGMTGTWARKTVSRRLDKLLKERVDVAREHFVRTQKDRFEALWSRVWPMTRPRYKRAKVKGSVEKQWVMVRAPDLEACDRLCKIGERLSRLYGGDAPGELEEHGPAVVIMLAPEKTAAPAPAAPAAPLAADAPPAP